MPAGIVEELFIATDPATALVEVWYRNSNTTISLQVRQFLPNDPVSVQWGTWKSQFVVQTGTGSSRQYSILNLVRVGLSSGQDGIGPTAVAHFVRTESPATLELLSLHSTVTFTTEQSTVARLLAAWTRIHPGVFCSVSNFSLANGGSGQGTKVETGSAGKIIMLADVMSSSSTIQYGLDAYGDLILLLIRTPPTSYSIPTTITTTTYAIGANCGAVSASTIITAGSQTSQFSATSHLWIINNTRAQILFRTALPTATSVYEEGLNGGFATGVTIHSQETQTSGHILCGGGVVCKPGGIDSTQYGDDVNFGTFTYRYGQRVWTGDRLWADFGFIDNETQHTAGTTTVTTSKSVGFDTQEDPDTFYSGTVTYAEVTSTIDGGKTSWTYSVRNAWPILLGYPMRVIIWIKRTSSTGTVQNGLFLWQQVTGRLTEVYPFTTQAAGVTLEVLSGNVRDILWFIGEGLASDRLSLQDIETGAQAILGSGAANTTKLLAGYYKLVDFRFLYRAAELPGYFVDAWAAGNPATWSPFGAPVGFNLDTPQHVSWLDAYATLAVLPSGVVPPVIAERFRRDVIMKDDWQYILHIVGGVDIIMADDGVGTDVGIPGDPVSRAVVLCNPSTAPAAFIARFPGRSDGAEGTPAPLDVTASQRISENKFTSALSAQRYEDEPVIAFTVSASTSALLMLPQELQSSGLDTFRCIAQPSLQANPGADTHRAESIELLLRRGPGQSMPGTAIMGLQPVTSNILDNQGGTVGTSKDVPGLGDATAPVKAPVGQLVTGRFLSFILTGTNVNSVWRYLGSFIRGRRTT